MSDAIVVLGCKCEDGSLTPMMQARIEKGVELYRAGVAPVLILCGRHSYQLDRVPPLTEAMVMFQHARSLGVPEENIVLEQRSMDTIGNAYFTKHQILEPRGMRSITLVTSAVHATRAAYIFRKILGSGYTIDVVGAEGGIPEEQMRQRTEHEQRALEIIRQWLDAVPDGDDERITELLLQDHPVYSDSTRMRAIQRIF